MSSIFDSDGSLALGQPAPDFNLPGVDGKSHRLADYTGKVKGLAVIFSCNHCPTVIKYEERMMALGREFAGRGAPFVLISANDVVKYPADSFDNMKRRAADKSYPFPYLYDEPQSVARAYGAQVTPHIFLFDAEMKLVYRGALDDNADNPAAVKRHYLREALEAVSAASPDRIANPKTRPVGCSVKWK